MKKIFAAILVVSLVFSMTGCFGPRTAIDSVQTPSVIESPTVERETEKPTTAAAQPSLETNSQPTGDFEEVVAIDNDECLIKIVGAEQDDIWGYSLKAYLENKSADKTYMYTVENASVNGVSWDPFFATEVAPGKKANEKISFSDELLESLISEYTDIELVLRVYDTDDWMADDVAKETVHIYPYGEEKATTFVRESGKMDVVIADNDDISIIVTGYKYDDIWGYTASLFLENKTDTTVMFGVDDVSVNGFMCDPFWATTVASGKVSFSEISWSDSSFEENGITDVEEIEMTIYAYDDEDFTGNDIYRETVVLRPKNDSAPTAAGETEAPNEPTEPVITETTSVATSNENAVYYSTNDLQTAKEGDMGIFAYRNRGSTLGIFIYWIIDFDEGVAYRFIDGNGDGTCDRIKISSGTLNDVLIVTYHDGSDVWSYGLHFKWKNQPDHLIVQDENGLEYDFYPTDLKDALNIRDTRRITDY